MNELNNIALAKGNYNNIPTLITSNKSVVNLTSELTITKKTNKTNWTSGNLTYTITITNKTNKSYKQPVVTDIIDTSLVDFIEGSVKIDNVISRNNQYNYNTTTHILTINLKDITPYQTIQLNFSLRKRANKSFILKSYSELKCNDEINLKSNYVTATNSIVRRYYKNTWCGTPKWRI